MHGMHIKITLYKIFRLQQCIEIYSDVTVDNHTLERING